MSFLGCLLRTTFWVGLPVHVLVLDAKSSTELGRDLGSAPLRRSAMIQKGMVQQAKLLVGPT